MTTNPSTAEWTERYAGALMNTFGAPKTVLARGEGAHVWDADGREYVDLLGGIAVNALGHAHPRLVAAVTEQLQTLGHISNFFASPPQITLAERLGTLFRSPLVEPVETTPQVEPPLVEPVETPPQVEPVETTPQVEPVETTPLVEPVETTPLVEPVETTPLVEPVETTPLVEPVETTPQVEPVETTPQVEPPQVEPVETTPQVETRVFFTNSGSEANEAAFKLTRRTGRTRIVATEGSFHGRTMGALALTSKLAYREPFEPLPGDVVFVPYGDIAALEAAVDDTTAAVLVEPIQGEAGVIVPPRDYLPAAERIAHEHGALLWLDEIQTGAGRTGTWFAHQNPALVDAPVTPDIVTLAKGLAGGIPIGVCLATDGSGKLFDPGNHGTTFGGNPVAAAAALAVLDVLVEDDLLARATALGARLREGAGSDPRVTETRGAGLLIGLTLAQPRAAAVVAAAQDAGFLLNAATPERIRMAPPLVLTDADVDAFVAAWPAILDHAGVTS